MREREREEGGRREERGETERTSREAEGGAEGDEEGWATEGASRERARAAQGEREREREREGERERERGAPGVLAPNVPGQLRSG